MHLSILAGTTSKIVQIPVYDSSSAVGANLTGLAFGTSGLTCYYNREGASGAATVVTLVTATKGTWTSSGFVAVDGTNMQGWYELHIPNAAIASGAKSVAIQLDGAANMVPVNIIIELTATDNQDGVAGGMSALPSVASGSAGAIPTTGTGSNQISVSSGRVTANADQWAGTTIPAPNVTGVPKVDLLDIAGAAVSTSTAQLGVNAVQIGAAVPGSATIGTVTTTTTATNLTNAPTAGDFTATMKTSLNAATPASVTGAVASVTGNVGGNVTGSVGSVTAAVLIQSPVRKNVAIPNFPFQMYDTTGALKTGLTVTPTVKIDAGSFAAATNAVTEIANGTYVINLAAADVNGNVISLRFSASGAVDTYFTLFMQP
jgi:hypothetical protein